MKKVTIAIVAIILVALLLAFSPRMYAAFWWVRGALYPDMVKQGLENYRKLPSEYLIKKLHSISPYNAYTALDVLAERKETKAVPDIIEFLKSQSEYKRESAIRALSKIGDPRAIEPLFGIVKKGPQKDDYEYLLAIEALAKMKFQRIYQTILQMEKENFHISWVIDMLENFPDQSETLVVLERIHQTSAEQYIREKAKKAIEHIETLQK